MVSFMAYDLVFLAVFIVFVILLLSIRKKNVERQGLIYLYKTKFGIKFIDKFAKSWNGLLRPTQYLVLISGYVLMVGIIWLMLKTTYLYLTSPMADVIRAPPVAPLIPYFPKIFGLESFFPPLYFTYFIIALGIVAVTHEAAHGIFARFYKFKVKSTGFAFFGPFFGAFVEPDEKQMQKAKKFKQMVVLGAGTFANVLMTILFGIIMLIFFAGIFTPAGVGFHMYSVSAVPVSQISVVGDTDIGEQYVEIDVDVSAREEIDGVLQLGPVETMRFFADKETLKTALDKNSEKMLVFDDSPAFREQMRGAIVEIDGKEVKSLEELQNVLGGLEPGKEVVVKTAILESGKGTVAEYRDYEVEMGERDGKAFLGIGFLDNNKGGLIGLVYENTLMKVKDPLLHYTSSWGDFGWFIYYLLWWVVVINILVALFNMFPVSILDGGRFFYLTVWGLTGSEKIGRRAYKTGTWLLILMLAVMMVRWGMGFF